jgi:tol-pal system protein YbgF
MTDDMIAPNPFPSWTLPRTRKSRPDGFSTRLGAAALVFALAFGASIGAQAPAARAQDARVQGLIDRIDRLQREVQTLQRAVYRGENPPPAEPAPLATGVGTAGSGELETTAAARLALRLSQLETQMRELTGQIEESNHRQTQLREQIDKLAADTDLRLRQLEQNAGLAPNVTGLPAGQAQPDAGQGGTALLGQPQGEAATSGGGTNVLGTVPAQDLAAVQSGQAQAGQAQAGAAAPSQQAYALQGATVEEQYQNAFSLLSQSNYGEAELALRAFVDEHPDDPLAGNAKYWLGETYYVRQDFQQAAITFAEAYQRYPDNSKAADNLLKLGMSLSALGSNDDACGTFAELLKRYPNAPATVQQRANQERQRLNCK